MNSNYLYILDENDNPILEPDVLQWAEWNQEARKKFKFRVADEKINGKRVSTVFLGLDHNYFGGEPLLWETMVFDEDDAIAMYRCSGSRADALNMHDEVVKDICAKILRKSIADKSEPQNDGNTDGNK